MKKIYKFLLFSLLINTYFVNPVISASNKGPATEYQVNFTKVELCALGSTTANCLNPVTISTTTDATMDIAAVASGAAAGTMGTLALAPPGEYTFMQITINRSFTITGQDEPTLGANSCLTSADAANLTTLAAGQAHSGNTAASVTLNVPPGSVGDHINGSTSAGVATAAAGTINNADTHFHFRKIITGGLSLKEGNFPSIAIAFDVSTAVQGNHNTCTNAHMNAAEPTVTISFQ